MKGWIDTVALAASYVGGATAGSGQSTVFKTNNINSAYGPVENNTLWAFIVCRNGYTPTAFEEFTLRVWIARP